MDSSAEEMSLKRGSSSILCHEQEVEEVAS